MTDGLRVAGGGLPADVDEVRVTTATVPTVAAPPWPVVAFAASGVVATIWFALDGSTAPGAAGLAWSIVAVALFRQALLLQALELVDRAAPSRAWTASLFVVGGAWLLADATPTVGFLLSTSGALALVAACASTARSASRYARLALAVIAGALFLDVALQLAPHWDRVDVLRQPDGLPARLVRLAAMAGVAVPSMALLSARTPVDGGRFDRWRPTFFAFGMVALPVLLASAALVHHDVLWVIWIGADAVVIGVVLACLRRRRAGDRVGALGWGLVAASMIAGLCMGGYSFGGPLPAPDALSSFLLPARVALRDLHVHAVLVGIALVRVGDVQTPNVRRAALVVAGLFLAIDAAVLVARLAGAP